MKKKIITLFAIFLFVVAINNKVSAYTTERYLDQMIPYVSYNAETLKSEFNSAGYVLTKSGSCGSVNTITSDAIRRKAYETIQSFGYVVNGEGVQDKYYSEWYNGENGSEPLSDPFPSYMFGKWTSRRSYIQWTSNNRMYIAWINIQYNGTEWGNPYVYVYTNETINQKLKDLAVAEEELEKLENAYRNEEPGENDNYSDVAKWVYSDNTYNESKQLKELAKTDTGIEKMKKWKDEINNHIKGGSDTTDPIYLARTILKDLIEANKDPIKIEKAADKNKNNGNKVEETIIAKIKSVQGESREERGNVFTNDVLVDIDQYKPNDIDSDSAGKIETATSKILTVISNIGIAVSVIMLAILGIKYMIGSVEERAEYKQGLVPYVIGAFILFGVTTVVKILMAFGDKIANI